MSNKASLGLVFESEVYISIGYIQIHEEFKNVTLVGIGKDIFFRKCFSRFGLAIAVAFWC